MHPMYNMSGSSKKNKKMKFKSVEAKREYELSLNSEFGVAQKRKGVYNSHMTNSILTPRAYVRETAKIPSRGNGMGNAAKPADKVYTGSKMIGVATLHKSNAVPVFSNEEAINMANMRR